VKVEENEDRQNSEERRKGEDRRCVIVWKSLEKKKKKCRGGQLGKCEGTRVFRFFFFFFFFLIFYFNGVVRTGTGWVLGIFPGPHPHPAPHCVGNPFQKRRPHSFTRFEANCGVVWVGYCGSVPLGPAHP
jgi:hypothetical protein